MSWKIDYLPNEHVVLVTAKGPTTIDEVVAQVQEALVEAKRRGTNRFLCDYREMDVDIPTAGIYDIPSVLRAIGVQADDKVAVIFKPGSPNEGPFRFYDNRAYNTGLNQRVFGDRASAMRWLAASR